MSYSLSQFFGFQQGQISFEQVSIDDTEYVVAQLEMRQERIHLHESKDL